MREAQNYGLMKDTKRTAGGATPLRRAKYPRLRGLLRRASRAFKTIAESGQPARLPTSFLELFSYSLLLAMSGEQKKVHRSPVKGFCDTFVEKTPRKQKFIFQE